MTEGKHLIAKWLEISAHIGIVAGLLLVAYQINQEQSIAAINLQSDIYAEVTEHYQLMAGESPAGSLARALEDPTSLTAEDHVVLYNLYMAEFAKEMRQEQINGYEVSMGTIGRWLQLTSNPYGYAWWKTQTKNLAPFIPSLYAALEVELSKLGPGHAMSSIQSVSEIEAMILEIQQATTDP